MRLILGLALGTGSLAAGLSGYYNASWYQFGMTFVLGCAIGAAWGWVIFDRYDGGEEP